MSVKKKEIGQSGRPTLAQAASLDALVLDGARKGFCRKGVAGASVEDIAKDIGVSKHTIYRRYPSKSALLDAVIERDMLMFKAALQAAQNGSTEPLETVRRTALRYFEIGSGRSYAALYLSVNAEAALSRTFRQRLALWTQEALEPILAAVVAGQLAGVIRAGDPKSVCAILIDLLEGANNRVRLHDDALSDIDATGLFEERWKVFLAAMSPITASARPKI